MLADWLFTFTGDWQAGLIPRLLATRSLFTRDKQEPACNEMPIHERHREPLKKQKMQRQVDPIEGGPGKQWTKCSFRNLLNLLFALSDHIMCKHKLMHHESNVYPKYKQILFLEFAFI
ncbi:hypothetical protein RRG08_002816 [Elysia crispata]|uniref:Uncharacterized protein n=1 Tax=Elysia crispata TaxID=231223 RepID=A0AAE0XUK5_9GAST|nr:hypothetical protein RRG08_002816 [Elysia crispata]